MKEWNGRLPETNLYQLEYWYRPEEVLLFDIETTGFSPKTSLLYMIGFCYYRAGSWHYRMLFNEDARSELFLLEAFEKVLSDFSVLIHYNGDTFDLPYLSEKYRQYCRFGISLAGERLLSEKISVDLYKELSPFRKGLELPNLKLTTVEAAMKRKRLDTETGGSLIPLYHSYVKQPTSQLEERLFQHNYADIQAVIPLLQLLHYRCLSRQEWELLHIDKREQEIRITLQLEHSLPLPYTRKTDSIYFHGYETDCEAVIPLTHGRMQYDLPNWKDYYYLPLEHRVVHKSIGKFVEASFREPAKKQNSYLEKEGCFLPYPKHLNRQEIKKFHTAGDPFIYLELTQIPDNQSEFWLEYLRAALPFGSNDLKHN